ncbi:hypothetical protein FXV77_09620 [Sphingobacterium phlebotomi]|uniref:Uncharacterized protein n=1 Tax=Sphingobacterium phlebotomi TaxID=2605433 RepID=A0A5D4H636_9SPHI|nr:hypothetical protein [Sphingobacterium phlebotomi]TYR36168.1 hypothetical protein FXV77_09620 [Sphingobacterium phlebotomi]
MTALKIKYLKSAFTVFALCLIGTASAATNGNGDEKEAKKEVKVETAKVFSEAWFSYDGTGDQDDPASYMYNPSGGGCSGNTQLCEIRIASPSQDPEEGLTEDDLKNLLVQETGNPSATEFSGPSSNVHFQP